MRYIGLTGTSSRKMVLGRQGEHFPSADGRRNTNRGARDGGGGGGMSHRGEHRTRSSHGRRGIEGLCHRADSFQQIKAIGTNQKA